MMLQNVGQKSPRFLYGKTYAKNRENRVTSRKANNSKASQAGQNRPKKAQKRTLEKKVHGKIRKIYKEIP